MNSKPLNNKVAIVTGAGHPKGIGAAIARSLANQGATVVVTDLESSSDGLDAVSEDLASAGGKAMSAFVDVVDGDQVNGLVARLKEKHGRIDILVNNAGVGVGSSKFLEQTDKDFEITFGVNVRGMMRFCQAVIPHMQQAGEGAIVNVSSLCGLRNIPPTPPCYTASKFAVIGMTKAIAQEFGPDNIRCNAVCPGSVNTQMKETMMSLIAEQEGVSIEQAEAEENEVISLGRAAEPAEIASVVAFLCSPAAAYVTGAALPVDGGMTFGL